LIDPLGFCGWRVWGRGFYRVSTEIFDFLAQPSGVLTGGVSLVPPSRLVGPAPRMTVHRVQRQFARSSDVVWGVSFETGG